MNSSSKLPDQSAPPTVRIVIETRAARVAEELPREMPWEDIEHDILLAIDDKIELTIDGRTGTLSEWRERFEGAEL